MKRIWCLFLLFPAALLGFDAGAQDKKPGKITWKKIVLDATFRSEGVAVADVNKDGKLDIIVGDCWYEAPKDPAGEWKRQFSAPTGNSISKFTAMPSPASPTTSTATAVPMSSSFPSPAPRVTGTRTPAPKAACGRSTS